MNCKQNWSLRVVDKDGVKKMLVFAHIQGDGTQSFVSFEHIENYVEEADEEVDSCEEELSGDSWEEPGGSRRVFNVRR